MKGGEREGTMATSHKQWETRGKTTNSDNKQREHTTSRQNREQNGEGEGKRKHTRTTKTPILACIIRNKVHLAVCANFGHGNQAMSI